jgi:hypothetical protein
LNAVFGDGEDAGVDRVGDVNRDGFGAHGFAFYRSAVSCGRVRLNVYLFRT